MVAWLVIVACAVIAHAIAIHLILLVGAAAPGGYFWATMIGGWSLVVVLISLSLFRSRAAIKYWIRAGRILVLVPSVLIVGHLVLTSEPWIYLVPVMAYPLFPIVKDGGTWRTQLTKVHRAQPNQRQSLLFVIFPVATLLVLLPIIRELPPVLITRNFNLTQILLTIPVYFGFIAAPGYLYAWSGFYNEESAGRWPRIWARSSLALAVIVSTAGFFLSILSIFLIPLTLASAVCAILMFRRFEKIHKNP